MNWLFYILLPFLLAANLPASQLEDSSEPTLEIYFFVSEKCPICQYYTAKINQIEEDYPSAKVILVFPNDLSTEESMEKFKDKYKLTPTMKLDREHDLVQRFEITVTPEVVVYSAEEDSIFYQGRIDDNYYRVGKRKLNVQSDDLINALNAIKNETAIETAKTIPVGCFISQKPKK